MQKTTSIFIEHFETILIMILLERMKQEGGKGMGWEMVRRWEGMGWDMVRWDGKLVGV